MRSATRRLAGFADGLAHALAFAVNFAQVALRPVARLWRLTALRAQTRGEIPVSTQFDGPVTAFGTGTVTVGVNCRLGRGVQFDTADGGEITLGQHVRINAGSLIAAACSVSIGDHTLIGEYVSIRDADHGTARDALIRSQPLESSRILIGRDVWIGRGCCILKGVQIGDGAVIGANSVVTRDVEPGAICVGAPIRQIGIRRVPTMQPAAR